MHWKSLYPPISDVPTVNFHDFLFERPAVKDQEDYTAFIDGPSGDRITFRQVKERVADAATALDGIGLKNGQDIVGILSENSIEFPTLIIALLKLAVPFSLLPAYATEAEVSTLVKLSKATYIFASAKLYPLALCIAKERGILTDRIFTFGGQVNGVKSLAVLIDDIRTRKPPRVPSHPVQDKTLAYLAFSSGTSGLPKGVMISHRNLYYSGMQPMIVALTVSEVFTPPALDTPEGIPITLAATPFYHAMGMHNGILRLLAQPGTAIIIPKWDVNLAFDMIKKYSPTNMSLVPSMIYQMVTSPRWETEDLSKLSSMGSGAAHLPPELSKKLLKRTPNVGYFYIGYGMSECTLATILTPFPLLFDGRFNNRPNMTGILLPGIEARIVRDDGTLAAPGEPGELQVKSGAVGLGYWENEKATREAFLADGWLRTGDRFSADADGAFYYVDRGKDILKVSGSQVSPTEIEDVLLQHPEQLISDVAVAGVGGVRMHGEHVPRAWIVLTVAGRRRGTAAVVHALDEWVKARLSRHKWLRGGFQAVDEIPKTATGKVLRRLLQDKYAQSSSETGSSRAKL